jgi:hypothetical protein
MTRFRLEILQWFGFFAASFAWYGNHIVGSGLTQAQCNPGGAHWGISNDAWQLALLIAASLVILGAEAAAIAVFLATRGTEFEGTPPRARMHFFAAAAMAANLLFLMMVLLNGIASLADVVCRQS